MKEEDFDELTSSKYSNKAKIYFFVAPWSPHSNLNKVFYTQSDKKVLLISKDHIDDPFWGLKPQQEKFFDQIVKLDDFTFLSLKQQILEIVKNDTRQISIIFNNESAVELACELREFFKTDQPGYDILRYFRNKDLMKQTLIKHDPSLRVPEYLLFESQKYNEDPQQYIKEITKKLSFPMFVKPIDSQGSMGAQKINDIKELDNWFLDNKDVTNYEIDEFVDGDLFHCDSLIRDERIVYSRVFRYSDSQGSCRDGMNTASILLEDSNVDSINIKIFNEKLFAAYKKDITPPNGGYHLEVFKDSKRGDIVFVEIAARVPGATIPYAYIKMGLPFEDAHFNLQMHGECMDACVPKAPIHSARINFASKKGKIDLINTFPQLKSNFFKKELVNVGDFIDTPWCPIHIVLWNESPDELKEDYNKLLKFEPFNYRNVEYFMYAPRNREGLHYSNTLESLQHEYDKGYRFLEIDLREIGGEIITCFHDWITFRYLANVNTIRPLSIDKMKELFKSSQFAHVTESCTLGSLIQWLDSKNDIKILFDIKGMTFHTYLYENLDNFNFLQQNILNYIMTVPLQNVESADSYEPFKRLVASYIFGFDEKLYLNKMFEMIKNISNKLSVENKQKVIPIHGACNYVPEKFTKSYFELILDLGFKQVHCDFGLEYYVGRDKKEIYSWLQKLTPAQQKSLIYAFDVQYLKNPDYSNFLSKLIDDFNIATQTFHYDPGMGEKEMQEFIILHEKNRITYMPNLLLYPSNKIYEKLMLNVSISAFTEPIQKVNCINITVNNLNSEPIITKGFYLKINAEHHKFPYEIIDTRKEVSVNICHSYKIFEFINYGTANNQGNTLYLYNPLNELIIQCDYNSLYIVGTINCNSYIYLKREFYGYNAVEQDYSVTNNDFNYPYSVMNQDKCDSTNKIMRISVLPNPNIAKNQKESINITNLSNQPIEVKGWYIEGRVFGWQYFIPKDVLNPSDSIEVDFIHVKRIKGNEIIDIIKHSSMLGALTKEYCIKENQHKNQFSDLLHSEISNYIDDIYLYNSEDVLVMKCGYHNPIEGDVISCISVIPCMEVAQC